VAPGPLKQSELIEAFLKGLETDNEFGPQVVHRESIAPLEARFQEPAAPLPPALAQALAWSGVTRLFSHQAEALDLLRQGRDAIVATPTASGKSLIYWLPVLERLFSRPEAKALFVFPLKALEQDQLRGLQDLAAFLEKAGGPRVEAAIYDGDTPPSQRRKIRSRPPQVIITNPDMLHLGLLAYHDKWAPFFSQLSWVVLDEAHTYRGIFGSHIVQVIRRLNRVAELYGARPQYLLSSATIDNPADFGRTLIGRPVEPVIESGAPRSGRFFTFVNPELSAAHTAARLLIRSLRAGLKTIVFTQARKVTELIHMWVSSMAPELKVSAYRAGFLPSERRRIEADLASGRLDGVVSTSALELGIDIGALDLCLLVGYPGTIIATWQRAGRVGRSDRASAVILIAQPDALDQYLIRHPADFFGRGFEPAVVDPDNREVVGPHLVCAAAELPLAADDESFGLSRTPELLEDLERRNQLVATLEGKLYLARLSRPHSRVDIRSVGESYAIMMAQGRRVIGTLDGSRAFKEAHPGAIYLHLGQQYLVDQLDLDQRDILAHPVEVDYYTRAQSEKETEILEVLASRPTARFVVRLGRLKVTEQVVGYEKRRIRGQELLSTHPLDLPPQTFETVGLWVELEPTIKDLVVAERGHFMGGIHAMEHAAIAMFPLLALCDRNDVGGIAYPHHPQLERSAVFIYDGYPGGVGLAKACFGRIEELLDKARRMVAACPCEEGCPSCIHSPKCGSGNKPLDKAACLVVLEALLGLRPWAGAREEPKPIQPPEPVVEPAGPARPPFGVLDIETQRLAQEVGGWSNARLMGLSVAVLYDGLAGEYRVFEEKDAPRLIERLKELPLVVGFNLKGFDFQVLSAYTDLDFSRLPCLDLLEEFHKAFGFRVSLDHLAQNTLGAKKSADGLQAVEWFRNGEMDKLIEYCRRDVEITKELFEFGLDKGYVVATNKQGRALKLKVNWAEKMESLVACRA